MSVIFTASMEANLNEWGATSGADVSWSADAALAGTAGGMKCIVDDATPDYCYTTGLNSTTYVARLRYYFDINDITQNDLTSTLLATITDDASVNLALIRLSRNGASYYLEARCYDDEGSGYTAASTTVVAGDVCIEFKAWRESGAATNDGGMEMWVDGVSKGSKVNLGNYVRWNKVGKIMVGHGANGTLAAGSAGTSYFDEVILNDDGGGIGFLPGVVTNTVVSTSAICVTDWC